MTQAACVGLSLEFFFPFDETDEGEAAAWCRSACSVVTECGADTLAIERQIGTCHGVFGGMTARERSLLLLQRRATDSTLIEHFVADHPDLSVRGLEALITDAGGPSISYRTLARRRQWQPGDAA